MSSANSFNASGRLSAAETAELAAGLAELTKVGLPLPTGLRALAEEWPSRRLRPILLVLADRLEQGVSLEEAITSPGARLPAHFQGLIIAGVRSGRLAQALEQYVFLQRTGQELKRQVWLSIAYPTLLMILMSFMAILANFYIINHWASIYRDFGTSLPVVTRIVLETSGPFTCFLIVITALMLAIPLLMASWPGSAWISPMLYLVPIIGPTLKWRQMARFSRLMEMLLDQQAPLPEALRLTAKGLDDAYLTRACRKVAADIEKGRPFCDSIAARRRFSPDLLPLVEWGQRTSMLNDAFRSAAEMFEGRANSQGRTLETFLLPATFLLIISFCGFFVIGLLLPLVALITRLSGVN